MSYPFGKRPLGAFPLLKIGLQRQRFAAGVVQRRRQFVNITRTVNQQQPGALTRRLLSRLSAYPCAAPVMATTLLLNRIVAPYAAALWLAINFSYQKPAGETPLAQRRGYRIDHRWRPAQIDIHIAIVEYRVIEMFGHKTALRASALRVGNHRQPAIGRKLAGKCFERISFHRVAVAGHAIEQGDGPGAALHNQRLQHREQRR